MAQVSNYQLDNFRYENIILKSKQQISKMQNQYPLKNNTSSRQNCSKRKVRDCNWSIDEQIRYIAALKENIKLMRSHKSRKSHKVFKIISNLVKTRDSIQVKSHHQKLQNKYHNISGIIFNIQSYLKRYYESAYRELTASNSTPKEINIVQVLPLTKSYTEIAVQTERQVQHQINHLEERYQIYGIGRIQEESQSIDFTSEWNINAFMSF